MEWFDSTKKLMLIPLIFFYLFFDWLLLKIEKKYIEITVSGNFGLLSIF